MSIMPILITLVSLSPLILPVVILLHVVTKKSMHATRIETGGMMFKVKGNSVMEVIDDLQEHYFDPTSRRVVANGHYFDPVTRRDEPLPQGRAENRRERGWLEKQFGIVWISALWPFIKVHDFKVTADKLKPRDEIEKKGLPVRQWVDTDERDTNYLRFRFPHPVTIEGIELVGSKWQMDLSLTLDIQVIKPIEYVFDYKGKILNQVDAAVIAVVVDFFRIEKPAIPARIATNNLPAIRGRKAVARKSLSYDEFIAIDKGPTSDLANAVMALNDNTTSSIDPDGIIERFGVKIVAVYVNGEGLSPADKEEQEASKAAAREKYLADGEVEKARGIKAKELAALEANAEWLRQAMDALGKETSDEVKAEVVADLSRSANLAKMQNLTHLTIVNGDNKKVTPTVPINNT